MPLILVDSFEQRGLLHRHIIPVIRDAEGIPDFQKTKARILKALSYANIEEYG